MTEEIRIPLDGAVNQAVLSLLAENARLKDALWLALDAMEAGSKLRDPAWNGVVAPTSAIGRARAALAGARGD